MLRLRSIVLRTILLRSACQGKGSSIESAASDLHVESGAGLWCRSCGCKIAVEKMKKPKKKLMTPLELATEAYYANMTPEALKAERELEDAIAGAAKGIDFDNEP